MRYKNMHFLVSAFVVIGIVYLFIVPEELMARAGGGGSFSHSSSSSSSSHGASGESMTFSFVITLIVSIFSSIVGFFGGMKLKGMMVRKNERARALLEMIDDSDPIWDRDKMLARIEEIYFAVQKAWTDRDQDIAKEYMSERIYKKHKAQTDGMKADGLINKLERINLEDVMIIGVIDFKDDSKDRFKAVIFGGMVDYMWDEKSEMIINGTKEYKSFVEIWNFVRQGDKWVLDQIEQSVDTQSVKNVKVYSDLVQEMAA